MDTHLNPNRLQANVEQVPIRNGYGAGLVKAGEKNRNVVALCADLTESTRTEDFAVRWPERFVEVGVAEQDLATVASGMAATGKIPFVTSYATFSPGRNWEQIRTTIAYNDVPVKVIGSHTGVSVGPDGATHQALEDIAIMRALPNMVVIAPCDYLEAERATLAALKHPGPVYIRLAREATPVVTTKATPFKLGQSQEFRSGTDLTIVACGSLVYEALMAADVLSKKHVEARVLNMATVKPLDGKALLHAARETGAIVSVEEHQITGGLGGAVAEFLAAHAPVPQEFIGVQDQFGESGAPEELLEKFHLKSQDIVTAAQRVLDRKQKQPAIPRVCVVPKSTRRTPPKRAARTRTRKKAVQ